MDQTQLCLEDLNQIIKMFSYSIQQRIQELNLFDLKIPMKIDDEMVIVNKYQNSKIKSEKDIQSVNKFCQRIMQIFSYFKSRSNHKNLLSLLEQKLVTSMDHIIMKIPLCLGHLIKLIVIFVKTPFQTQSAKKSAVQLSMSSFKLKISPYQRSKPKIPYTSPFNQMPNCIEHKYPIVSAQPTKYVQSQKPQSRLLRTSMSGAHIRRNVSDVTKSNINKRSLKTQQDDLKFYDQLDLDKRYIQHTNYSLNNGLKEKQDRLQKELLKRNQIIKQHTQLYLKEFQDRNYPLQSPSKALEELTLKKHNIPQPVKKLKNGRFVMKNVIQSQSYQGKREMFKKSRAHTSMKDDFEPEMTSNLFRQRKYKKAYQQNLYPRPSVTNSSFGVKQSDHLHLLKIV